jgi:lipopolysaccharide transport system ATP-binding protein
MLNGLIKPDKGKITMKGRIGALIELGAGFNPILTGRENIYNNGAVLGFSKKEIDNKFDDIVKFSEIEEFIDTPVQNYSSGMKVRLGFAVASQMEPDILIIDEVLAVGDLGFVIKCLNSLQVLMQNCAVIFVTHNMPMMSRVSTRSLLIDHGHVVIDSVKIGEVIEKYTSKLSIGNKELIKTEGANISDIKLEDSSGEEVDVLNHNEKLTLNLCCELPEHVERFNIRVIIRNIEQRPVIEYYSGVNDTSLKKTKDFHNISLFMGNILLNTGKYSLSLVLVNDLGDLVYYRVNNAIEFNIVSDYTSWSAVNAIGKWDVK